MQASASKLQQLLWTTAFEDLQLQLCSADAPGLSPYIMLESVSEVFSNNQETLKKEPSTSRTFRYTQHIYTFDCSNKSWTIVCDIYVSSLAILVPPMQCFLHSEEL